MSFMFPKGPKPTISFPLGKKTKLDFKVLPRISVTTPGGGGDMTGEEILAKLLLVDGEGSLLDADTLDGHDSSYFATLAQHQAEVAARIAGDANLQAQIDAIETGGGPSPIFFPETYGAVSNGDPSLTVEAFATMMAAVEAAGGGIVWLLGRYNINAPIVWPATVPVSMMGIARGKNLAGNSSIISVTGDHDLIKFQYGADRAYLSNFNIGCADGLTPTTGWTVDARWLSESKFENLLLWNNVCGAEFGVGRAMILDGVFIIGIAGTVSQFGTDVWGRDLAFGVSIRSSQTLLLGNESVDQDIYYDHDGPGVLVPEKAKGTNFRLRNVRVAAKVLDDEDINEGISEEYNENAVGFDIMGASTVRMEACQAHSCRHAIRVRHAPNIKNRLLPPDYLTNPETGKQMCSGLVVINFTSEACLNTYNFGGYEKLYCIMMQANGVATDGYIFGDDPGDSYPGIAPGLTPVDVHGGVGTFGMCNALTCHERGFKIRAGINRLIEPQVAGYSSNRLGDIDPGSGVPVTVTTTSQRVPFPGGAVGDFYPFRNDGVEGENETSIWVRAGDNTVVATNSAPSIEIKIKKTSPAQDGWIRIERLSGQTHVAFIRGAGTDQEGEIGRDAKLLTPGIEVEGNAVNGTWVHGGIVSGNKSLKTVGNIADIGPAMRIGGAARKVFVDGLDCCEEVFENNAITAPDVQVQNLKRSTYRYDPFRVTPYNEIGTTTYTFGLRDMDGLVRAMSSSATTFTVPLNSAVPFPVGAEIHGIRGGSGTLNIAAFNSSVNIRSEFGGTPPVSIPVPARHQYFKLYQHAINDWTFSYVDTSLKTLMDSTGISGQVWKRTGSLAGQYGWGTDDVSGGGGGEANTITSVGAGESLVAGKVGVDLQVKSLLVSGLATRTSDPTTATVGVPAASQPEAEAGTISNRAMTPQRTKEAIVALLPPTVHAYANKVTPDNADEVLLLDSTTSYQGRRTLWSDIKTALNAALAFVPTTRTVTGGGLSAPGAGGPLSANVTVTITEASAAEAQGGTLGTVAISPRRWRDAFDVLFGPRVAAMTLKAAPVATDEIGLSDSQSSGASRKTPLSALATLIGSGFVPTSRTVTGTGLAAGSGGDLTINRTIDVPAADAAEAAAGAILTKAMTPGRWAAAFGGLFGTATNALAAKPTPVAGDIVAIGDFGAIAVPKKITLAQVASFTLTGLTSDSIAEGTTNRYMTAAQETALANFITQLNPAPTQPIDLDTVEAQAAAGAAAKLVTDWISVSQPVDLDTIETNSNASKVKTDLISITAPITLDWISVSQPVNLDTVEADATAGAAIKTAMDATGSDGQVWKRTNSLTGPSATYGWGSDLVGGAGGGETNTLNLFGGATGVSIVSPKVGVDLFVKGIKGGGLVVATVDTNDVILTVTEATAPNAGLNSVTTEVLTPRRWADAYGPQAVLFTAKGAPASGDLIGITSISESNAARKTTVAQLGAVISAAFTIAPDSVTDAMLRNSAALSVIGRAANSIGDPADIAAGTDGHVLRRAGTALGFGQLAIGAHADGIITLPKLANIATARLLGRVTAPAGVIEELTGAQGLTLIGAAPVSHTHTTGEVTGLDAALAGKQAQSAQLQAIDDLTWAAAKLMKLTGASAVSAIDIGATGESLVAAANAAAAQATLGLVPGTGVQAYSDQLKAIDDLTWVADRLLKLTGASTVSAITIGATGESLIAAATAAAARTTLELVKNALGDYRNSTLQDKVLTAAIVHGDAAVVSLGTAGATVTPDFSAFINAALAMPASGIAVVFANPSVPGIPGMVYTVKVTQGATTPSTLTFGGQYHGPGGDAAIVLTPTASRVDVLYIKCWTATEYWVSIDKDMRAA